MGRSERWATDREKKKTLSKNGAGPILYLENDEKFAYSDESHIAILGESGTGKSRRLIIPMILNSLTNSTNKESFVIADPKGEIYSSTIRSVPKEYVIYKFDFRNLYREDDVTCWNPLAAPYELWKMGTDENIFRAEQMVDDLAHALYPVPPNENPFWTTEARNMFEGAVYSLFSYAKPEEVNLTSLFYFFQLGDEKYGASTYVKELVSFALDDGNENVAMGLQSYVSTAPETRGGIRSSFLNRLSIATRSGGVRSFLSNDDIHINTLKGDKPIIIYIILPDETPIYEELAGMLISQLMNHYIYVAEDLWSGKLPIRINFCLDELGNIGESISNLPHLLSAGRSRNVRVELVLQSLSQLDDIYGKSNATTIISNTSVKVLYRVSNYETLSEFSRMCGEKETLLDNGLVKKEPLISPVQLGAMDVGQALVIISGRTKYITRFPDYTDLFNLTDEKKEIDRGITYRKRKITKTFDVKEYVKARKNGRLKAAGMLKEDDLEVRKNLPFPYPFDVTDESSLDAMIKDIDRKIAELEAEEREEKRKEMERNNKEKMSSTEKKRKRYSITINTPYKVAVIKALMKVMEMPVSKAKDLYDHAKKKNGGGETVVLSGLSKTKADQLKKELEKKIDIENIDIRVE